jgi:membrane-associated protease RseP (regulator of RpoE activity)
MGQIAKIKRAVADVMRVDSYEFFENHSVSLRGALTVSYEQAMQLLRPRLAELGYGADLQAQGADCTLTATPGIVRQQAPPREQFREVRVNPRLNIVLFVATVISVIITGGLEGNSFATLRLNWTTGLMFAGSLLSILIAHEMGHFVVGRLRGEKSSWPFFIPLPLISIGGTLGAVIFQGAPFKNRRNLLEVGIAGPLAGFVVAVPLFLLGLYLTDTTPTAVPAGTTFLGDSLLTQLLGSGILGSIYTSTTESVVVHPVAYGAWIGLLITGINLMPAGQLDGGHIAYALFGVSVRYVSYAIIGAMILLSFISEAWVVWAILLFLFGRGHPPVVDPSAPLSMAHYGLALAGVLVLILTFVPRPIFTV